MNENFEIFESVGERTYHTQEKLRDISDCGRPFQSERAELETKYSTAKLFLGDKKTIILLRTTGRAWQKSDSAEHRVSSLDVIATHLRCCLHLRTQQSTPSRFSN